MKRVHLDLLKSSVASRDCYPLHAGKTARRDWLKGCNVMMATLNTGDRRHVANVKFFTGKKDMTAMMDCVTGSLYRDGRCLSSDALEVIDLDEGDYTEDLMAKPAVDWRAKQW